MPTSEHKPTSIPHTELPDAAAEVEVSGGCSFPVEAGFESRSRPAATPHSRREQILRLFEADPRRIADCVVGLEEQFEAMRSQAEEIITLRDASVAKRTVWLSQWGDAGWSADLGRAVVSETTDAEEQTGLCQ